MGIARGGGGGGGEGAPREGTLRSGWVARKSPEVESRVKAAARPPPRLAATMVADEYSAYPLPSRPLPACSAAASADAPAAHSAKPSHVITCSSYTCSERTRKCFAPMSLWGKQKRGTQDTDDSMLSDAHSGRKRW